MNRVVVVFVMAVFGHSLTAYAQSREPRFGLGVQFVGASSGEFEKTDLGVSGGVAWHPVPLLGLEVNLGIYPGDSTGTTAFSRRQVEGLFGVTIGPRLGRVRPFAKVQPGFVVFRPSREPIACVLIFPPPLTCVLATGHTVAAVDLGGGIEVLSTRRTFLRFDISDRMLRYPGTTFDTGGTVRNAAFFSHDVRFAAGGGWRF
jgi:hypothetical protein